MQRQITPTAQSETDWTSVALELGWRAGARLKPLVLGSEVAAGSPHAPPFSDAVS